MPCTVVGWAGQEEKLGGVGGGPGPLGVACQAKVGSAPGFSLGGGDVICRSGSFSAEALV